MAQGIAYNKEEVMKVLEEYFRLGMNVSKACKYAGIDQSTVSRWLKDDPTLSLKVQGWQNLVNMTARKNIVRRIEGRDIIITEIYENKQVVDRVAKEVDATPDVVLSQWWLKTKEKEDGEFTERVETVNTNISYEELKEMQKSNLEEANIIEESMKPKKGLYDTITKRNPKS